VKRFFDFFFSLFLLVFLSPFFLLIGLFIYITMGKPILFVQDRAGYHGQIFKLIKFRTMINDVTEINENNRITKFGSFLRSTSLDELPELYNILIGQMSFVGPRPLLVSYLKYYSEFQNQRHNVLPGLTGWAQINGRNLLSWKDRFILDVWYVHNRTFFLDLKILLLTVYKVIFRKGINDSNNSIMPPFRGEQ